MVLAGAKKAEEPEKLQGMKEERTGGKESDGEMRKVHGREAGKGVKQWRLCWGWNKGKWRWEENEVPMQDLFNPCICLTVSSTHRVIDKTLPYMNVFLTQGKHSYELLVAERV